MFCCILNDILLYISPLKRYINEYFKEREPWEIVAVTGVTVLLAAWLWQFLFQDESLWLRTKQFTFRVSRKIPYVARKIESEKKTLSATFEHDVCERVKGVPYVTLLPSLGLSDKQIIEEVEKYLSLGVYDWQKGFVSGTVYYYDDDLVNIITKVYGLASYTNPLHADVFPGICKMEAEVIRMAANLFHGGPDACGTMTTGGTESIMMACKAYRDYAYHEKGIRKAEIILPTTAHPAFDKAAQYFSMRITHIPVDEKTKTVDIHAMEKAISNKTVMLVGSVPNFPYGTMDDMERIAALGHKYGIPVHADCCLGGFLTAFMPSAGFDIPPFDFSLSGITSISADTHKYGFTPKGSSVILYSEKKYRHYQFCVTTDWPGGVYGSPTVNGSRAGGIIAACWATLMRFGFKGYMEATKKIIETAKYVEEELRKQEDIFVFGKPVTSVIAIGSDKFHIYRLAEALSKKGWNLNTLQFPPGIHICITVMHTQNGIAQKFINEVKNAVAEIMQQPNLKVEGKMAVYGMAQSIPDRSIVGDITRLYLDSVYFTPKDDIERSSM